MTDLEKYLKEVKERCDAATEGPWVAFTKKYDYSEIQVYKNQSHELTLASADSNVEEDEENFEFIAHARTDVPRLVEIANFAYEYALENEDSEALKVLNKLARGDL